MTDGTTELATIERTGALMAPKDVAAQVQLIQHLMAEVMKDGQHYGKIPGCGDKPTLLLPGAQKLALTFGFGADYDIEQTNHPGDHRDHREYRIICKLTHRGSDQHIGAGVGCCSTMEGKCRFRTGPKKITGRPVPANYWTLRKSDAAAALNLIGKGNGTAKNDAGAWMITEGGGEKVSHDNPADYYNTVLKMAKKRAYVDALLTATAASDIFAQDLEDMQALGDVPVAATAKPAAQQQQRQAATQPAAQQQAAAPAGDVPSQASNNGHKITTIATVGIKRSGTNKSGNPYTIHLITDIDGHEYETFKDEHQAIAQDAIDGEHTVELRWSVKQFRGEDQYGLTSIAVTDQQPATAPPPAQQQEIGDETVTEALIHDVQGPKTAKVGGQSQQVYLVESSRGQFLVIEGQVAQQILANKGTGAIMEFTVRPGAKYKWIVTAVDVADPFGGGPDDVPVPTYVTYGDDIPF